MVARIKALAAACASALALSAAPALAAVTPDAGDTRAGAQAIESLPAGSSALVDRPGDRDWLSILGRNADRSVNAVFVRVLQAPAGCSELKVELFNPEGRWMRTVTAGGGEPATVLMPANASRYLIAVEAIEAGCSGLEYEATFVATEPAPPGRTASRCLVARSARIAAQEWLADLRALRRKLSPAAQRRYDGYIATARRTLSAARGHEKRVCA